MACIVAIILIYGPHFAEEKRVFWKELIELKSSLNIPFIVIGDFNKITCPKERRGCVSVLRLMSKFLQWIDEMKLF